MPELTDEQKAMCDISYLTKRKTEKNDQPERILQKKICNHLQTFYPDVYFFSDPSGLKLSPNILKLLKATRSRHTQLDIVILHKSSIWSGLILETKSKTPFQKNGELFNDTHLKEQEGVMRLLTRQDFKSYFVWELGNAIEILESYLGKPKTDNTPIFPKTNIDPFSHEEI